MFLAFLTIFQISLLLYTHTLAKSVVSETEKSHGMNKTKLERRMVPDSYSENPLEWTFQKQTSHAIPKTNEFLISKDYLFTNKDFAQMVSLHYTDKPKFQAESTIAHKETTTITENEFSTLVNPDMLFDWHKDGFENIDDVERKVEDKIESENLSENDWTKHKYFTKDEMKLMKKYLREYKLFNEQFISEGSDESDNDGGYIEDERTETHVKMVKKLMKELWILHLKESNHENHVYRLKPFVNKPPTEKSEIKKLESSFNQIVQSEKSLKIENLERNSKRKNDEMNWLIRVSLIFSITQPTGHHRYTSYELKLLRNLYEASCTDGKECTTNLKDIVPDIVDKFQNVHKYPRELHTKKLNLKTLVTAPISWLYEFLLPFIAQLNSRKLSSKDFNQFTPHFYSLYSWESSDVKTFFNNRQSIKQLKSLNKKLKEISMVYPKLDSLIDRESDIINYLCGNEMENIQRYKTVLEGLQLDNVVNEDVTKKDDDDDDEKVGDGNDEKVDDDDEKDNEKFETFGINEEENKDRKLENYTSSNEEEEEENNFEMVHPYPHTNDEVDEDDDGLEDSAKVSKLQKRNVNSSKLNFFANDNDGNNDSNNENKLQENYIKKETVRVSLEGRRISAKKLFEKTKKNFKKLVLLLQKEKKLLDFFHFKKINRFFGRFDMAAKKMI